VIKTVEFRVMWGSLKHDGEWESARITHMTDGQQLMENIRNGTLPEHAHLTAKQVSELLKEHARDLA
jgi:hypothetical protein